MQNVKKYVDEMFRELPNSERARKLKTEILFNMEDRYQELLDQKIEANEVEKQLISEIGTSEEIRENINLNNTRKQMTLIGIQGLMFVLAISYSTYVKINKLEFVRAFNGFPMLISQVLSYPIAMFFGTVLTLTALNHLMRPKGIFICKKRLRITFLITSMALMSIYLLFILNIFGYISILSLGSVTLFIMKYIDLMVIVIGVLFYLGSKE